MYDTGQGVPQDDAEADRWYRLAAEQGNASVQYNIGAMYDTGQGVPQDDAEALRWFRLAAEQGNASAQFRLGFTYGTGRGVPQDDAEALRWFRLAAEQGNASAQYNIGFMRTSPVGACRRTTLKPSGGSAWPPSRATPAPSTTSGSCVLHRSGRAAGRR